MEGEGQGGQINQETTTLPVSEDNSEASNCLLGQLADNLLLARRMAAGSNQQDKNGQKKSAEHTRGKPKARRVRVRR